MGADLFGVCEVGGRVDLRQCITRAPGCRQQLERQPIPAIVFLPRRIKGDMLPQCMGGFHRGQRPPEHLTITWESPAVQSIEQPMVVRKQFANLRL